MPIFLISLFCFVTFCFEPQAKLSEELSSYWKGKTINQFGQLAILKNQELAKIADDGSEDWLENDETVNLGEIWSRFSNCAAHFGS